MADNISVTAGSGTTIAADDVSGVLHQRVKLSIGGDGSAADAVGGAGAVAAGVQRVTLASDDPVVTALATLNGYAADTTTDSPVAVHTPCDVIAVTPTLDTSIYASGDTLFATTAITGATRANNLRSALNSIAVVDKDDQKPALRLLFFSANVTFGTINAAPSISDSDAASYLGHYDIAAADYVDLGGVSVACARNVGLMLEAASGTTTVYMAGMLTAGTPTHTASGLVFNLGVVHS